jgi:hypothetical protein
MTNDSSGPRWRRFVVDVFTALAALALASSAMGSTSDPLYTLGLAALFICAGLLLEPGAAQLHIDRIVGSHRFKVRIEHEPA